MKQIAWSIMIILKVVECSNIQLVSIWNVFEVSEAQTATDILVVVMLTCSTLMRKIHQGLQTAIQ